MDASLLMHYDISPRKHLYPKSLLIVEFSNERPRSLRLDLCLHDGLQSKRNFALEARQLVMLICYSSLRRFWIPGPGSSQPSETLGEYVQTPYT
jgi:hypothetical protein